MSLSPMFRVCEFGDLFADACLRDESGQLLFLSLFGRDGAIKQLMAAFDLGVSKGGVDSIHLQAEGGRPVAVRVNAARLTSYSGRLPKETLFGNLSHIWIFDPVLARPDRTNRLGWVMAPQAWGDELEQEMNVASWTMVQRLSSVPLLGHWRQSVMAKLSGSLQKMHESEYPPIGRISAIKVQLPESFPDLISMMIRARQIGLEEETNQACAA